MNLKEFLQTIWGEQEGTVCVTGRTTENKFGDKFFHWPTDNQTIEGYIRRIDSEGIDAYFVPSILRGTSRKRQAFKSSQVTWVDLDNGSVDQLSPPPSVVVQTSEKGFHAYWKLDQPTDSIVDLEIINKGLVDQTGADNSGWDATQLLRLPETLSKKRDFPVTVVKESTLIYSKASLPKDLQLLQLKENLQLKWQKRFSEYLTTQSLLTSSSMETLRVMIDQAVSTGLEQVWLNRVLNLELSKHFSTLQMSDGESSLNEMIDNSELNSL